MLTQKWHLLSYFYKMEANKQKIGWIGLGTMGSPMSEKLIDAEYNVTLYNRSKKPVKEGQKTASSPSDLITQTEIIFIMVSDDQAIKDIFTSETGLLAPKASGKTIINMSTVSPAISQEMAELCEQQGNYYLDAPVSGSLKQAQEATLVIMVGGDETTFQNIKPLLEKIGKLALRVGNTGAGNTAKLVINTLLGVHVQGLAEAFSFAEKQGLELKDLSTLLNNSALSNPLMTIKSEQLLNNDFKPRFALQHLAKDLRLAKDIGLSTPLGLTVHQTFQKAEGEHGSDDVIAIAKSI
ncbi:MAG: NAD(P)-dependent oxidoreductase [Pedobacter sp.]|nr:MAG: NAD(P)-dependent oxidoreductase [Pedobacter sp.]